MIKTSLIINALCFYTLEYNTKDSVNKPARVSEAVTSILLFTLFMQTIGSTVSVYSCVWNNLSLSLAVPKRSFGDWLTLS